MSVFFVTDCGGYACAVCAARINGERCSERESERPTVCIGS